MSPVDFSKLPIVRSVLPHTGRLDGDDTGFRDVAASPYDPVDPDSLVVVNRRVKCYPIVGRDAKDNFVPRLADGAVPDDRILLREPTLRALEEANQRLYHYGRELVVVDGFRHVARQARSFGRVLRRFLGGRDYQALTLAEQIELGRQTNAAILYVAVAEDDWYQQAIGALTASARGQSIVDFSRQQRVMPQAIAREVLTYEANLGLNGCTLDIRSHTAHGNGGAVDACLIDTATGRFVNRGIPFAYNHAPAVMDYFEWCTVEQYQAEVRAEGKLAQYLVGHGVTEVSEEVLHAIRRERRLLFHAMREVGATYFSLERAVGECWHFNLGNERGGRQFDRLPHGGNASHALLLNVKDTGTGLVTACWTNAVAHQLAEPLLR